MSLSVHSRCLLLIAVAALLRIGIANAAAPAKNEDLGIDAFRKLEKEGLKAPKKAVPAQVVPAPAVQDARQKQFIGLLQPAMWRELDFIRQVCDLTPEQRPKVRAAADAAVEAAAKEITKPQKSPQPLVGQQAVRNALRDKLPKLITFEQFARYTAEDTTRMAALKEAAISSAVLQLDTTLYLTQEQREKIIAELTAGWQPEWEHWLSMYRYAGQYFPQVPDKHVTPFLTPEQIVVWNGLQKMNVSSWSNNARRQNDDAWWGVKPAVPAAKARGVNAPPAIDVFR